MTFLVIVLLLKELGVLQAINRFLNEANNQDKEEVDDEVEDDEEIEEVHEDEEVEDEDSDEEVDVEGSDETNEEQSDVDSNVEEASEETFEEKGVDVSDEDVKDEEKNTGETTNNDKKKITIFDYLHADPDTVPKIFMKKACTIPKPDPNKHKDDHVIIFDFKPMERSRIKKYHPQYDFMMDKKASDAEYPKITYIDTNTAKLEESPNEVFYCTTTDMPRIRMLSKKKQLKELRLRKKHMELMNFPEPNNFIIDPFEV